MKKILGVFILRLLGWTSVSLLPDFPKYIIVSAPHTSNWDFVIGRCFAYASGIKPRYLIKSELYFWPLSLLIKWNGGIPVYRRTGSNMVQQIVKKIKTSKKVALAIAPEGTRKRVDKWKTGFYHIAKEAKIPLVLVFMDYKKKQIGCLDILYPNNLSKDIKIIENHYKSIVARYPNHFNTKIH